VNRFEGATDQSRAVTTQQHTGNQLQRDLCTRRRAGISTQTDRGID
jgi:hypothetical protein